MSDLHLYNSYTRQKEKFEPITPGHVGLYVCGPTVSGESHLGHARPYVTFDVVNRYLQHLGYKVRYVRNITDAGHFEEEGREAEDKVATKAILEMLEPMELVQKYTNLFHWGMRRFNCLNPSIEPTATGHIIEQISMIEKIIQKGFAYEVNGSVYFDVKKYASQYPYGKLSGRVLEDLLTTTRVLEGQDEKRDKADFALWKSAPKEHLMRWKSPWGEGFPGWHIECSAMSSKYLGQQFDIHGGGMDLKFPHHECEIAQNEAATGKTPVNYWMHANMLTLNGKKMAKSTGNNILPNEIFTGNNTILSKAFSPSVTRFFMLQAHYRSVLDVSNDALLASEKGFNRLMDAINALDSLPTSSISDFDVNSWKKDCYAAMNDDFNSPVLIANLFEAVKHINIIKEDKEKITAEDISILKETMKAFVFDVLGLVNKTDEKNDTDKLSGTVELLIKLRADARANKDFATSDKIRDELAKIGIQLKDGKEGTTFSVN